MKDFSIWSVVYLNLFLTTDGILDGDLISMKAFLAQCIEQDEFIDYTI